MRVKRLEPGDEALVRALMALFSEAFEDPGRDVHPPSDAYLRGWLARPDSLVLVAQSDRGELLGGLLAYALWKPEREACEWYLYDLAVHQAERRRGVATALIHALVAVARADGALSVYVQADPDDLAAVALYEGLGTRAEVLHFDLLGP